MLKKTFFIEKYLILLKKHKKNSINGYY